LQIEPPYTENRTDGAIFDPLFDSEEIAKQHGYTLFVYEENGFEVCLLTGVGNGIMPNAIIRTRYTNELPTLAEGEQIDFTFGIWHRTTMSTDNFTGYKTVVEYLPQHIVF